MQDEKAKLPGGLGEKLPGLGLNVPSRGSPEWTNPAGRGTGEIPEGL